MEKEIFKRLELLKYNDYKSYVLVNNIINYSDWYKNIDIDTFIYIMKLLDYSKEETLVIYKNLFLKDK